MRNILEYPITKDEVIDAINEAIAYWTNPLSVGDIVPLALTKAKEFIIENGPDEFYEDFDPRSKQ
ncbi:MAG: hypothetical protein M0R77_03085 [Gammaproteobacteria bacterium]|nr:hypothetical protein [Gammaproteobacteria bacterium]